MVRFAGIDVASEKHFVAVVDERQELLVKSTGFGEDAEGYEKLLKLLGSPDGLVIVMEATGHYWKNLFAMLHSKGFAVAVINPLRSQRFAGEQLERTKTDAIDAHSLACFGVQKRPSPTRLPDSVTEELRELVRHHDRLTQDKGDRVRQLHRLVDLGFPEFTRYVKTLDSELATALLAEYPTAESFAAARPKAISNLKYDGRHFVGLELAKSLVEAAKRSVGRHHAHAYRLQVRHACEDIDLLRRRLKDVDREVISKLDQHEVGTAIATIDGIGKPTAARLVAELGDPADFRDASALASYVGLVPATRQSGKSSGTRFGLTPIGHARLRTALWMPTLTAVKKNAWLRNFYERLVARGKPKKLALIAAMRKLLAAIHAVARTRKPFELREPQGART
jgi:transposase